MASSPVAAVSSENHLMLAPAKKLSSLPEVMTTASMSPSVSSRSRTWAKSSIRDGSRVLSSSPARSIVTVATPSATSRRKWVSCSVSVIVLPGSSFEDHSGAEAAGGALRDQRGAGVASLKFVGHGQELAGSGGAEGMAEADRASIQVELVVRDLSDRLVAFEVLTGEVVRGEGPLDGQNLGRERFVQIDHVDV